MTYKNGVPYTGPFHDNCYETCEKFVLYFYNSYNSLCSLYLNYCFIQHVMKMQIGKQLNANLERDHLTKRKYLVGKRTRLFFHINKPVVQEFFFWKINYYVSLVLLFAISHNPFKGLHSATFNSVWIHFVSFCFCWRRLVTKTGTSTQCLSTVIPIAICADKLQCSTN